MIEEYWDSDSKELKFELSDEVLKGCVITHEGSVVNELVKGNM